MNHAMATEALCIAVAKNDLKRARDLVRFVAQGLAPPRRQKIDRWMDGGDAAAPMTSAGVKLKHWTVVTEKRGPWVPIAVEKAISDWLREVQNAEALVEAGERVLPLLLVGETRCGKTSSLCLVAQKLALQVRRLSLADAVGSHLGESAEKMRSALAEVRSCPGGLWLADEIDGIAPHRNTDHSSSASQERAHAVGSLLSELESLPPSLPFCATTNLSKTIDTAVLGRFTVVEFPRWKSLDEADRLAFATSHGFSAAAGNADSYADVVKAARKHRVDKVLAAAPALDAELPGDAEAEKDPDNRPSETREQRELWLSELRRERDKEPA